MKSLSSILDFPRKTLPKNLWVYEDEVALPHLDPNLRFLLLTKANEILDKFKLELKSMFLYGGSASYQWSEGSDVDVSLYVDWRDFDGDYNEVQQYLKGMEIPFKGHPIHFYIKSPQESINKIEVADAIYDILDEEWVLPPLVLPDNFDPDEYFQPVIKEAERKAKKFDEMVGELLRSWKTMEKASAAKLEAKEPDVVDNRLQEEKAKIRKLVGKLANDFWSVRERRYALHDKLKEKLVENGEIGRFERFQEPEIVWKYLDRAGYNDLLWKLYKIERDGTLNRILEKY